MGKQNGSIKYLNNIYDAQPIIIKKLVRTFGMAEFAYNNTLHSST
jgi:hypothetical protein